jgi:unsaturated rhamnogalacturonyl hydrolase
VYTIQASVLLLYLGEQHPEDTQYATAASNVQSIYESIPSNTQGGFWHKDNYPNEMWLDGLYMAQPFLARFGDMDSSCGDFCFDTPVFQMTLLADRVRLSGGLFLHGWDEDKNAAWCVGTCAGDTGTGLSPEVWSRATGWFAMALVDTIRYMPAGNTGRETLSALLSEVAEGIAATQDPSSGLWCQVLDKCDQSDNWLESSGSAMFIYALKRGVDLGVLDASYIDVAVIAWEGLTTEMISESGGQPTIDNAAKGMSIQQDYAAYTAIERLSNSPHGLCGVLLAASAMEY